jgi:acyl carrier protein
MPDHDPELVSEVAGLVRKAAKLRPEVAVTAESRLVDDLGIDSLDLVGVFLQVQDHFDVLIDEDDLPRLQRVADLAGYVARLRPHAAA